jgi:hypothetical protein
LGLGVIIKDFVTIFVFRCTEQKYRQNLADFIGLIPGVCTPFYHNVVTP